jgi:hypothetical protein
MPSTPTTHSPALAVTAAELPGDAVVEEDVLPFGEPALPQPISAIVNADNSNSLETPIMNLLKKEGQILSKNVPSPAPSVT